MFDKDNNLAADADGKFFNFKPNVDPFARNWNFGIFCASCSVHPADADGKFFNFKPNVDSFVLNKVAFRNRNRSSNA
jgi:hypothetical protein